MKKIYWFILSAFVLLITAGIIYNNYKRNYIDTSTEYYRLIYTPPVEKEVNFGSNYTDPKFEIERASNYKNDSDAIAGEIKGKKILNKYCIKEIEKCYSKKNKGDVFDQLENSAKIEALNKRMSEQITIFRFTHRAGYKADDIFKFLKSYFGDSNKMKQYCKNNKISFAYYPIP